MLSSPAVPYIETYPQIRTFNWVSWWWLIEIWLSIWACKLFYEQTKKRVLPSKGKLCVAIYSLCFVSLIAPCKRVNTFQIPHCFYHFCYFDRRLDRVLVALINIKFGMSGGLKFALRFGEFSNFFNPTWGTQFLLPGFL